MKFGDDVKYKEIKCQEYKNYLKEKEEFWKFCEDIGVEIYEKKNIFRGYEFRNSKD